MPARAHHRACQGTAAAHGTPLTPRRRPHQCLWQGIFQGSDSDKEAISKGASSGEKFSVLTVQFSRGTRRTRCASLVKPMLFVVKKCHYRGETRRRGVRYRWSDDHSQKAREMIQFRYPHAPATKDIVPLARKVVDAL